MIWNLLIIWKNCIGFHCYSCLVIRITVWHRRIRRNTILLFIIYRISELNLFLKLIVRLSTNKLLKVLLIGFVLCCRILTWRSYWDRFNSLVLHNNIVLRWVLLNHLLCSKMISFLCSLSFTIHWLLINFLEPSVKCHGISRLVRNRLVVILWRCLYVLVWMRGAVFNC